MCREVHDRIDLVVGEEAVEQFCIAGVADDQLAGFDGLLESGTEVVQRDYRFASLTELAHDVAADISGPASDKYLLVIHQIYRFWATTVNHPLLTEPDSINTEER